MLFIFSSKWETPHSITFSEKGCLYFPQKRWDVVCVFFEEGWRFILQKKEYIPPVGLYINRGIL